MKSEEKKPFSLKHTIVSTFAWWYSVFLGWTTRVYWFKTEEAKQLEESGQGIIYAAWHNQQLFLLYPFKGQKIAALISQSSDGEYIARVLPHFGMLAVRGSSTRGGARALIKLMQAAEKGYRLMITPDGPRGPIYTVQPGILFLAKKLGWPIVPGGVALSHKFKVGSWDKMRIPLPFGKAVFTYGKTFWVKNEEDFPRLAKEIQAELNHCSDESEMFCNKKHFDSTQG